MESKVYPRNANVLHKTPNFNLRVVRSPIDLIIKKIDEVKTIPLQLENYFLKSSADRIQLIRSNDLPKMFNRISIFTSNILDVDRMMSLLLRSWKKNSKEKIAELIRVTKQLSNNLVKMYVFFDNKKIVDSQKALYNEIIDMGGASSNFIRQLKKLLNSKGIPH